MLKKIILSLIVCCSILGLAGCGESIKDWPATMGDTVFIDYTAVFETHPTILFETTRKEIALQMQAPLMNIYEPVRCKLGKDTTLLPVIQNALVGMKAGETKKVTVKPDQMMIGSGYDPTKITKELALLSKNAGIVRKKGDIVYKDGHNIIVKDIEGNGAQEQIVFDMNPLETYNNVVYNITMLQVGGKLLSGSVQP